MSSIPIIVCGRSPEIAHKVALDLQPEYDVVRIVLSPEQGIEEIPELLASQNPPRAVALGGAFDDATVDAMRGAAGAVGEVVWLLADKSRQSEMPPMDDKEVFGAALAGRMKASLQQLGVGREGPSSGVFFF